MTPLAETYRPRTLAAMVGQEHILGANGLLDRMLQTGTIKSMIFYGPPGTGKTTVSLVIAENAGYEFHKLNATTASVSDIKKIADQSSADKPAILYLDEIQYFNKKQQQSLLSFIEEGSIILIAATTENPYMQIHKAILSRCSVIEFKPVSAERIASYLEFILRSEKISNITGAAVDHIARLAGGDVRKAVNLLDLTTSYFNDPAHCICKDDVDAITPSVNMSSFDHYDDIHYDLLGGLQKSIRGSDPDAAAFYLARLLEGGDILSPIRRLMVIASEDIGLADPMAPAIVYACCESAKLLGLPEARIPLGHAALYLALAPKSNSSHVAVDAASVDIHAGLGATMPVHLRSPLFKGYCYPHDYPNYWVRQQYLPDDLKDKTYYEPRNNGYEKTRTDYWNQVKSLVDQHS